MCNDATGALDTLCKGSSASPELQGMAMEFSVLARDAGIDTAFLHAPGRAWISSAKTPTQPPGTARSAPRARLSLQTRTAPSTTVRRL